MALLDLFKKTPATPEPLMKNTSKPQQEILKVQRELEGPYQAMMRKHGFDYLGASRAGIFLCSILIQQYGTAKIIETHAAAGIVAEKVLEAAKTVPLPVQ